MYFISYKVLYEYFYYNIFWYKNDILDYSCIKCFDYFKFNMFE